MAGKPTGYVTFSETFSQCIDNCFPSFALWQASLKMPVLPGLDRKHLENNRGITCCREVVEYEQVEKHNQKLRQQRKQLSLKVGDNLW